MKKWFISELLALFIAVFAWLIMSLLDIANGTVRILSADISARFIIAVAIGAVASITISTITKQKAKQ